MQPNPQMFVGMMAAMSASNNAIPSTSKPSKNESVEVKHSEEHDDEVDVEGIDKSAVSTTTDLDKSSLLSSSILSNDSGISSSASSPHVSHSTSLSSFTSINSLLGR